MKRTLWITLILFATRLLAQNAIPAGTILPVSLNLSLNSRKVKPGQLITARIMQDVLLPAGSKIREGAKVIGHVVDVKPANGKKGGQISLRFDTLAVSKRRIPITTNLRAVASMMAVDQAQIPDTGPDRGTAEQEWVTDKVGGESTLNGLLVKVSGKPGTKCRGEIAGNDRPQALWVFSSDACGAYDLPTLSITHAGRTNPLGEVTLESNKGNVKLRAGSGMLLRVN